MVMKQLRVFTIAVGVLALVSNGLSVYLFRNLPNDTYRSLDSLVLYTYFATLTSLFGVVGSIKKHAYTLSILANFFILDTIVSAFSRFVLLYIFSTFRYYICDAESIQGGLLALKLPHGNFHGPFKHINDVIKTAGVDDNDVLPSYPPYPHTSGWGCSEMMQISIMVVWIGIFTSMLVQIFFAVLVRQYAKSLWKMQDDYAPLGDAELEKGYLDEYEQPREPRTARDTWKALLSWFH